MTERFMACAVFLVTASVYLCIGPDAPQGGDTVPNRYLPLAVACGEGTLDRFSALWSPTGRDPRMGAPYYATPTPDGTLVSTFGLAVPVLSVPFYAAADAIWGIRDSADVLEVSRVLAGLLCALAALLVYWSCRCLASLPASLFATAAFAFGSGVLSVTSRGLWQHTWATPLLALGTWALLSPAGVKERTGPGRIGPTDGPSHGFAFLAGLAFALAFACRPQTGFFLAAGWFVLAWTRPQTSITYSLAAFPVVALVFAHNTWFFDSPFAFAQTLRSRDVALFKTGSDSLWGARPFEAALGLLASPSRGLLVFSPTVTVGLAALLPRRGGGRTPRRAVLIPLSVAGLGQFVTAALWFDWWGGYTVSCRPLLDLLPLLAVLTAIGLDRFRRTWVRCFFAAALAWSIVLAASSALYPGVVSWNDERDVDRHPKRLWSVSDSLPGRILEFRPEDRVPLADSRGVVVVPCGVAPPDGPDLHRRPSP